MHDLDVLNTLTEYMEINIKVFGDIVHDRSWTEHENKVDYDLWVILEGEIQVELEKRKFFLNKNDIFFLPPDTIYQANAVTESCSFIYAHFDLKIGNNVKALESFSLEGPVYYASVREEVEAVIKSYFSYKRREKLSFLTFKGHFTVLVSKILAVRCESNSLPKLDKRRISKPLIKLQPILIYISDHIHEPLYIHDLANILGMSEKYFINFFKKAIGLTPNQFILQVKMNKALSYIYERKYSLKEISSMIGYPDQYTFSKAFKKQYGFAPSLVK